MRNIFLVFNPTPGTVILKPLELSVIKSNTVVFCYVNEATFAKSLGNLRLGTGD